LLFPNHVNIVPARYVTAIINNYDSNFKLVLMNGFI